MRRVPIIFLAVVPPSSVRWGSVDDGSSCVIWNVRWQAMVPFKVYSRNEALFGASSVDSFYSPRFHNPANLFEEVSRGAAPWGRGATDAGMDNLAAYSGDNLFLGIPFA